MKQKLNITESYRFDTENEAENFVDQCKEDAKNNGYTLASYKTTYKEKKAKGQVVDCGFQVDIVKEYSKFWGDGGAF